MLSKRFLVGALGASILAGGVVGCESHAGNGALIGGAAGAGIGAIIGNNSKGRTAEGALIGGAAGGVVGNQVSKCRRAPARSYSRTRSYSQRAAYSPPRAPTCRYENRAYYDAYGDVVYQPTRVCR